MRACPCCHQKPEVVHLTRQLGLHWCERAQSWFATNGVLWSTAPIKGVLRGQKEKRTGSIASVHK
jgi:hypothetical protein